MKEDVVMELMPQYTNMPPVSQTEFLQLKADGILRRNISRELFNLAPEVWWFVTFIGSLSISFLQKNKNKKDKKKTKNNEEEKEEKEEEGEEKEKWKK